MTATVFADPFSGRETLLIEPSRGPRVGASYDPRSADLPLAWHIDCPHCTQLRWKSGLTIHEKREIQIARCREAGYVPTHGVNSHKYLVPTNCHPHVVRAWQKDGTRHATVRGAVPDEVLKVTQAPRGSLAYEGNLRNFRAIETNLKRYLRFIFSARALTRDELSALLQPLVVAQRSRRPYRGHHKLCDMIDWDVTLRRELGESASFRESN